MAFFLIVPSVMVVSIMLTHALAKRLGLKIYYSTLIAVGLMSLIVISAATVLSPVPDKRFLLYLGGLILSTSFLLMLANNFMIKKQREEERIFTEQVKAAYAEELKKDADKPVVEEIAKPVEKFEWGNETPPPEENKSEEIIQSVDNPNLSEEFPLESVFKPLDDVKAEAAAKALEDKDAAPFEKPKPEENFPLQDAFKPLEVKADKIIDNESDKPFEEPKPEENFPLQETFKPLDVVKPDMLKKIQPEVEPSASVEEIDRALSEEIAKPVQLVEEKISKPAQIVEEKISKPASVIEEKVSKPAPVVEEKIAKPAQVVEEKVSEPAQVIEEKISKPAQVIEEKVSEPAQVIEEKVSKPAQVVEEKVSKPAPVVEEKVSKPAQVVEGETLDNILDKAYDARAKGRIWIAIENYKKALERYGSDEYAPFVAIDLGNIYKENALYAKAIKTYESALNLPAVKRNAATKKDFMNNLEYLRVVRDILLKHHASTTPFAKIPKEILQEIDAEFQKAQLRSRNSNKF